MTSAIEAIVFDFDDTIVDSRAERISTLQSAASIVLRRTVAHAEIISAIKDGSSLQDQASIIVERGERRQSGYRKVQFSIDRHTATVNALITEYRRRYFSADRAPLTRFPGIEQALTSLQTLGIRLALVTSRPRMDPVEGPARGVNWELDRIGMGSVFEVVVGYEDTAQHKPSPDPFLACLQQMNLASAVTVAIGDSPSDVLAARAAGIRAGAASWGSIDRTALWETNPDFVLTSPWELMNLVR